MKIEPMVYDAFSSLINSNDTIRNAVNSGCAWYVTTDHRIAGRVYLEPKSETFRFSVLCFARSAWEIREPSRLFAAFEDAEAGLFEAMRREAVGKPVTIREVPFKVRFGKGRTRDATPTVDS